MIDQSFFEKLTDTLTLQQVCAVSGARLSDEDAHGNITVSDVAPLDCAGLDDVSFFENRKYLDQFTATKARACFVTAKMAEHAPENVICLVSESPYLSYALTAQAFYPIWEKGEGISGHAVIASSARLGKNVSVAAGAVIKDNVRIGDNSVIGANAVIERAVQIGAGCHIAAQATLSHCIIGERVSIATGARIGQPGFGFAVSPKGFVSVPQLGRVILEDDVDIGANTTIDRGTINDTIIRKGTRIDNLVQLGHNVETGNMCVIVSQTGISGSTKLGNFVMTGGQSGFAGHLKISDGVKIAGQAGVTRDIDAPGEYAGMPAQPLKAFMRQFAILKKMTAAKKGE